MLNDGRPPLDDDSISLHIGVFGRVVHESIEGGEGKVCVIRAAPIFGSDCCTSDAASRIECS